MTLSFFLVVVIIASMQCTCGAARFVGGSGTYLGQFPYFAIVIGGGALCGGSIINSRFVLTAAHCLKGRDVNTYTVTVGTNRLSSGGRTYKALTLIWSSSFNSTTFEYDVGFVKTEEDIQFNSLVQPIPLATVRPAVGETVTIMGFGHVTPKKTKLPEVQQFAHLVVMELERCKGIYRQVLIDFGVICTSEPRGRGICKGDSGSPLVNSKGQQVGITSFGPEECGIGAPDAFMSVIAYKAFIDNVLKNYK